MITIGPAIELNYRRTPSNDRFIPKVRAKVGTPFDFVALDAAVAAVMGYGQVVHRAVRLQVTLPGGSICGEELVNER
jgi:hypothetical protein